MATKTEQSKSVFHTLSNINVDSYLETKSGLKYLSWVKAWEALCDNYPDAFYEIKKFTNPVTGVTLPYLTDEEVGYIVFTSISIEGQTHEMWLPAMNGANKALKPVKYTYTTKYGEKTVEAISMVDINKTIMRCLTKNMAMFGLGINVYAGEDFPEEQPTETAPTQTAAKPESAAAKKDVPPSNGKPELTVKLFEKAKTSTPETIKKILTNYNVSLAQKNVLEALANQ